MVNSVSEAHSTLVRSSVSNIEQVANLQYLKQLNLLPSAVEA